MKQPGRNALKVIHGEELKAFVLDHCVKQRVRIKEYWSKSTVERRGFFRVEKPMHVFKKVRGQRGVHVIANLIIPAGALIYVESDAFSVAYGDSLFIRKMRASRAFVHSLVTQTKQTTVTTAVSGYSKAFKYTTGSVVEPAEPFSKREDQCDSGIHFFINMKDALGWSL